MKKQYKIIYLNGGEIKEDEKVLNSFARQGWYVKGFYNSENRRVVLEKRRSLVELIKK